MKLRRGAFNIFFGLLSQIISIALGVLIPRFVMVSFGSEVNGLISSISQIYTYLALLEAGVGLSTLQALYGLVAKDDKESINKVLSATHIYYKRTGFCFTIAIIILSIVYPLAVRSNIDPLITVSLIYLGGLGSVINFFFQGKFRILLQAEGKEYVLINLSLVCSVLISVSRIVLLLSGFNVIIVQSTYFIFSLFQMVFLMLYRKHYYTWLRFKVSPDFNALSQNKSVLVHQIAGLLHNNTDILLLTVFCDLKVVSVYTMYMMLFNMISTALASISNGLKFSLGQAFNTSIEQFKKKQNAFEAVYIALTFSLNAVAFIFILPFMRLYTNGIDDINYIDKWLPLLFLINALLMNGKTPCNQVIIFAQHFKKTQWRAIAEAIINLIISIVLVNFMGIYGVLIGTTCALLYRSNDMIIYSNKRILNRSPWVTYRKWLINGSVIVIFTSIANSIMWTLDSYIRIVISAGVLFIVILIVSLFLTFMIEREAYRYIKEIVRDIFIKLKNKRAFKNCKQE